MLIYKLRRHHLKAEKSCPQDSPANPWKTSFRVNIPNGIILNLGIFPTLTDQNACKYPQNGTKKPEHPQRSGFLALFYHIVQCSFNRILTLR